MENFNDVVWALGSSIANKPQKISQITRTVTPVVDVRRDELINAIKQASKDYQAQLDSGTGTFSGWEADMFPILTQPTNKGRLESEVTPLMGALGGVDKMFEAIGQRNARNLETAKAKYDALTQEQQLIDALMAREEAAAIENAKANAMQEVSYKYDTSQGMGMGGESKREGGLPKEKQQYVQGLADIATTVRANPENFDWMAANLPVAEKTRTYQGWIQANAKDVMMNEFKELSNLLPKGFSSAINTEREMERMSPYTEAIRSGVASKILPATQAAIGAIYDRVEQLASQQGYEMPTSREAWIQERMSSGREYNPYSAMNPDEKMYYEQFSTPIPTTATTKSEHQTEMDALRGLWL